MKSNLTEAQRLSYDALMGLARDQLEASRWDTDDMERMKHIERGLAFKADADALANQGRNR